MAGKKTLVAVGGALAALALVGCAQRGTDLTRTASGQPAQAEPTATAPADAPSPQPSSSEPSNPQPSNPQPSNTQPSNTEPAGGAQGSRTSKLVAVTTPKMGDVVTDQGGWILYRFDSDTARPESKSACEGQCAQIWPPALADGAPELKGVSAELVGTVSRADGSAQLTLDGWPLYRYAGDAKPGQWKGQGVGGTWFVVAPDGKKNLSCLPTGTPTPVAPPASSPATSGGYGY